jgi:hypothetical protein
MMLETKTRHWKSINVPTFGTKKVGDMTAYEGIIAFAIPVTIQKYCLSLLMSQTRLMSLD